MTAPRRRRNNELLAAVTARLERVAGHMPPHAFAALVRSVVEVTLKYEGYATPVVDERRRGPGGPPRGPDAG
jgi:hypothetical protein